MGKRWTKYEKGTKNAQIKRKKSSRLTAPKKSAISLLNAS